MRGDSPGAAGGHAQWLLVSGVSQAADGHDDSHEDQRHRGGQHDVQPDVEV